METRKPRSRRLHPAELKARAVGMVEEIVAREGNRDGVLAHPLPGGVAPGAAR